MGAFPPSQHLLYSPGLLPAEQLAPPHAPPHVAALGLLGNIGGLLRASVTGARGWLGRLQDSMDSRLFGGHPRQTRKTYQDALGGANGSL